MKLNLIDISILVRFSLKRKARPLPAEYFQPYLLLIYLTFEPLSREPHGHLLYQSGRFADGHRPSLLVIKYTRSI